MPESLQSLEPIPTLLHRLRAELRGAEAGGEASPTAAAGTGGTAAGTFDLSRPIRLSRAPGRLDVMGGIADYTGSLVCEATLQCAAGVALQARDDREIQIFSFNLLDEHLPFTFRISLDALARSPAEDLAREFAEPGRRWAGYLAGCFYILHEQGLIDLTRGDLRGANLALYSTVPPGAGVSSSAAIEVATMMNLADHFQVRNRLGENDTPPQMRLAALCQQVENRIVGAPCGIMDQVTSCCGHPGSLLRLLCQPHELQASLAIPDGMRFVGIDSRVKHSVGGSAYARTRCAAFMAHAMILEKMRDIGRAANRELLRDPMRGYLANLDADDYKRFFRPYLPDSIAGRDFLNRFGATIDPATRVEPEQAYAMQSAADHHVLEARRVRNFARCVEESLALPAGSAERGLLLDKAGHLMYGSHLSYTNDAMLGADECDLLVNLVRQREKKGLYGAKITGGGSGGTVAVLCETSPAADAALSEIMSEYHRQTGNSPRVFLGSSLGAWDAGTEISRE